MAFILIIDDDPTMRTAVGMALKAAGHQVELAANGREGVRQHSARPADVVVTDLFMPEQEGLETIMELRKKFPKVPIVAMSGANLDSPYMLRAAQELGAIRILHKPFQTEELITVIEETLAASRGA